MRLICTIIALFFIADIYSQNRMITGKVVDQNSSPVPNASVLAKGTKLGVATDANGTFSISIPSSVNTLVVSSISFVETEVDVSSVIFVTVSLQPSTSNLSEVVLVA